MIGTNFFITFSSFSFLILSGLMGVTGAGFGASYDRNQAYENCLIEKGIAPQAPVSQDQHPLAP